MAKDGQKPAKTAHLNGVYVNEENAEKQESDSGKLSTFIQMSRHSIIH